MKPLQKEKKETEVSKKKNLKSKDSKSSKRSDHKHIYKDCIVDAKPFSRVISYCEECGRVALESAISSSVKLDTGKYFPADFNFLRKKYPDLPYIVDPTGLFNKDGNIELDVLNQRIRRD